MDIPVTESTVNLSAVRYDTGTGLVPVVVQDAETGAVLMLAYANREAVKRTLATKQAWFWSRSRQDYWRKGATSGHVQHVVDVRMDCDGDALLYLVHPQGPACHTGATSCFYRSVSHQETSASPDAAAITEAPVSSQSGAGSVAELATGNKLEPLVSTALDPNRQSFSALADLWRVIDDRFRERPEGSYTTYLFAHGAEKIGKKVGEEAVEVALASLRSELTNQAGTVAAESADLLYHLMVLWRAVQVAPNDVLAALAERR